MYGQKSWAFQWIIEMKYYQKLKEKKTKKTKKKSYQAEN